MLRVLDSVRWINEEEDYFLKILQSQGINPTLVFKDLKIRDEVFGDSEGFLLADVFRYRKIEVDQELMVALSKGTTNGNSVQEAYLLAIDEVEENNTNEELVSSTILNHILEEDNNVF